MEFARTSRSRAIAHAVQGPARPLPHAAQIQRAFGGHDVSAIRAQIAGPRIAGELDAAAFTLGRHVVFASPPDLHTAAHEAAHVVQQQSGSRPQSDEGPHGAALEHHADAVAGRVVSGQGAAALLSSVPIRPSGAATGVATPEIPIQRARRRQLNAKQVAQRQRLLDRRVRRYGPAPNPNAPRIAAAADEFQHAVDNRPRPRPRDPPDYHPSHVIPFDYDQQPIRPGQAAPAADQPVDEFVDRLPAELRRHPQLRRIAALRDPLDYTPGPQTEIDRGGMHEVLSALQFAKERGIDPATITRPRGVGYDFSAIEPSGKRIPFDPFNLPAGRLGGAPESIDELRWARGPNARQGQPGAYYDHTHSKGGDPKTVGVLDTTYGSPALAASLNAEVRRTGAHDQASKVHELRIPLAQLYAEEHVAAEGEIPAARDHYNAVRARYVKAQIRAHRRNRQEQRLDPDVDHSRRADTHTPFREALTERRNLGHTPRAAYWRAELAKHPAWKTSYGS